MHIITINLAKLSTLVSYASYLHNRTVNVPYAYAAAYVLALAFTIGSVAESLL